MRIKNFLNTIKVFLISYIISSFVTTCSLLIYLSSLMETLGHEFTEVEIREASIITFNNILIIALLFTFLYYIVKKITVDIPIKKIKNCLSSLMNGDFSARVKIKKMLFPRVPSMRLQKTSTSWHRSWVEWKCSETTSYPTYPMRSRLH